MMPVNLNHFIQRKNEWLELILILLFVKYFSEFRLFARFAFSLKFRMIFWSLPLDFTRNTEAC